MQATNAIERKKFDISRAGLKWIAIVLMLMNHLCCSLSDNLGVDNYFIAEASWYITRIAFVIFAYQVAEGMCYTKNRTKYIISMFIFAVVSEIPFDLCFRGTILEFNGQNVMWTLAIGALSIAVIEEFGKKPLAAILVSLVAMALCTLMKTDYTSLGVITVISFYYFRDNKAKQLIITAVLFAVFDFTSYLHSYATIGQSVAETLANDYFWYLFFLELHALVAFPLFIFYNGRKGKNINKWFFYAFYPGHLLIIYLITTLLLTA